MLRVIIRRRIFQESDQGWQTNARGPADLAAWALEGGTPEMPPAAIPDLPLDQGQQI